MAKGRIIKRAVDAAKVRTTDSYLWDRELTGFGLKVTPAGRKVYLVQYQLGGRKGRTRRVTIGQHGELTPTAARAEAKRLLGRLLPGVTLQTSGTRQRPVSRWLWCLSNSWPSTSGRS